MPQPPAEPVRRGVPQSGSTPWERAAEADRWTAQVVFNRPLDTAFHYLVPDAFRGDAAAGDAGAGAVREGGPGDERVLCAVGPAPETNGA